MLYRKHPRLLSVPSLGEKHKQVKRPAILGKDADMSTVQKQLTGTRGGENDTFRKAHKGSHAFYERHNLGTLTPYEPIEEAVMVVVSRDVRDC